MGDQLYEDPGRPAVTSDEGAVDQSVRGEHADFRSGTRTLGQCLNVEDSVLTRQDALRRRGDRRSWRLATLGIVAATVTATASPAAASTPGTDARLTHDDSQYVSDYTLVDRHAVHRPDARTSARARAAARTSRPSASTRATRT